MGCIQNAARCLRGEAGGPALAGVTVVRRGTGESARRGKMMGIAGGRSHPAAGAHNIAVLFYP
jgi:hypothetical protein